ncbi:MAG: YggS family pyridoxal phosphate-dependent enzyme [Chloroflexi bacterium]|nr:YggS family pyridoxal phosphate-dependent enzyme [Chloroflexota bacterium]
MDRIVAACGRAGRDPATVRLVAISKTVAAERIRAAVAAGQADFGENRVQEAEAKRPLVGAGEWHLVGPLQANKARRAVETFEVIESVDSVDLARRLDRLVRDVRGLAPDGPTAPDRRLPVLLQVNVDADRAKAGFLPSALEAALGELTAFGALRVDGLMTIGRLAADPQDARSTFVGLHEIGARLRARTTAIGAELSMGMSDDYPIAVEEGATIVRVGRALFGERVGQRPR